MRMSGTSGSRIFNRYIAMRSFSSGLIAFIFQDIFVFDSSVPSAISKWTNEGIDEQFGNALLRAIDTKDIGVTTPKSLATFVGNKTIKEAVMTLKNGIDGTPHLDAFMTYKSQCSLLARSKLVSSATTLGDNLTPTLVWIDDNPRNNTREVLEAQRQGVTVVQLPSTAVAKMWIEENYGMPIYDQTIPS